MKTPNWIDRAARGTARGIVALVIGAGSGLSSGLRRLRASTRLRRGLQLCIGVLSSSLRISLTGLAIAALILGGLFLCLQRVPPASIGVLQTQWGGGIAERDYEPGLHFGLRGWQTWHLLDGRTHFAFFGAREQGAPSEMLDLRTKEGNEIKVSVLVPYRILPGEGHLLVRDGLRSTYATLATATIKDVLMQDLAELTAEEFASTPKRFARLESTLPRLNALLARYHLRAETIQIHQVEFREAYEQILQKKQLTRQLALLAKAATLVEQEMRVNTLEQDTAGSEMKIRGEMDKELETILSEGKVALSRIRSETREFDQVRRTSAQAEVERMTVEGDRALAVAAGLKELLTNAAYDSPGGRIDLARQGAANLRFREVVLNANDPRSPMVLDVAALSALLLGKAAP
ncbi:MAG: SPFH domain-containing protein [Planctomycetota bacterium]